MTNMFFMEIIIGVILLLIWGELGLIKNAIDRLNSKDVKK